MVKVETQTNFSSWISFLKTQLSAWEDGSRDSFCDHYVNVWFGCVLKNLKAPADCFHSMPLPHSWAQPPNFSATPIKAKEASLLFPRFNRDLLCLVRAVDSCINAYFYSALTLCQHATDIFQMFFIKPVVFWLKIQNSHECHISKYHLFKVKNAKISQPTNPRIK